MLHKHQSDGILSFTSVLTPSQSSVSGKFRADFIDTPFTYKYYRFHCLRMNDKIQLCPIHATLRLRQVTASTHENENVLELVLYNHRENARCKTKSNARMKDVKFFHSKFFFGKKIQCFLNDVNFVYI